MPENYHQEQVALYTKELNNDLINLRKCELELKWHQTMCNYHQGLLDYHQHMADLERQEAQQKENTVILYPGVKLGGVWGKADDSGPDPIIDRIENGQLLPEDDYFGGEAA